MGTDAQAEEEDRKGPVRQRQETGTVARLSSLGVPQQPGGVMGGTLQVLSSSKFPSPSKSTGPSLSFVRLTT